MDKTKKMIRITVLMCALIQGISAIGQNMTVEKVQFCDRAYQYGIGNDTIKVYFNLFDDNSDRLSTLRDKDFKDMFYFYENDNEITDYEIERLSSGIRIPREYTFSILLDQNIPLQGKKDIVNAIKQFVEIAPDSSVYFSTYGSIVSNSIMLDRHDYDALDQVLSDSIQGKAFYSGVYSKLAEFSQMPAQYIGNVKSANYTPNPLISNRAAQNPGKNIFMVFAEGSQRPDDEILDYLTVTDYQAENAQQMPKVYAFYYTADGENPNIEDTLNGITHGQYKPASNIENVLSQFEGSVEEATYDYMLSYTVPEGKTYIGNVDYQMNFMKTPIGSATYSIGSVERPWPEREQSMAGVLVQYLVAILVTLLTFMFFFVIMKIFVPCIQSWMFKSKYYVKYEPEANITRRICHYCKQEIKPGQVIVKKCNHWMHKYCWIENGYKCAEFGQNCKTGIQKHVDWHEMFKWNSLKECSQTIIGILAGLISWCVYEICGRGGFNGLAKSIVGMAFNPSESQEFLFNDCVTRTSSFLMIGLLLGFFISLVFRYTDDVRDKDWRVWIKIVGLSILTAFIGMLAFAIGADLFCVILSFSGKTFIPWYCSLPAYILFSISVSLALTIKSTIPVKSALLGGLCSSFIGFVVLYFTKFTSANYAWLNMLLDFIIYGGGLGASLVTVRMLAEKYFLVIQNGAKSGMRIPIHKWMNATGGGNKVSIGMTGDCEIQMNWEKSNKVAKVHATLYIDPEKNLPVIKPQATGVIYNMRAELPVNRPAILSNNDTFKIGDTIFKYEEA